MQPVAHSLPSSFRALPLWLLALLPAVVPSARAVDYGANTTFRSLTDSAPEPDEAKIIEKLEATARWLNLDDEGRDPSAAPPSPVAPNQVRLPAVGKRALSPAEVLRNLHTLVRENSPPEAVAAFERDPAHAKAGTCAAAAAAALLSHREIAAVAALLRAHELDPKNADHLANLAAVIIQLRLPRHALVLLQNIESSQKANAAAPGGLSARAVLLANRGHALLQVGRLAEADAALREALRLEPALADAYKTLATVLFLQGGPEKKAEAVRFYRRSIRPVPPRPPAQPPRPELPSEQPAAESAPTAATAEQDAADEKAERRGRPSPYAIFDMSHGKAGGLPSIKIPQTIADGHAMHDRVKKLLRESGANATKMIQRSNALDNVMRQRERSGEMPAISAARARDVFWYIAHIEINPRLRALQREATLASQDLGVGSFGGQLTNPWGSHELMDKHDKLFTAHMDVPAYNAAMWAATEPYHATWLGPIHRLDSAVNRLAHEAYPYMTAIAANLSDPVHHEYAMLRIQLRLHSWSHSLLAPLRTVCRYDYDFVQSHGALRGAGSGEDPTAGETPEADWCPGFLEGEFSVTADFAVAEVSINCEKIGIEISGGEWLKGFVAVERNWSGETSIFFGAGVEAETPGEFGTGASAAMKSGFYVGYDAKGRWVDFGLKSAQSAGVSSGFLGYEREVEHSFSLVTAPN